ILALRLADWRRELQLRTGKTAEWHAVGHSAGATFHCHFLPALQQALLATGCGPAIKTVSLLAPAVRTDLFQRTLAQRRGRDIRGPALVTRSRRVGLRDNGLLISRTSLLSFLRNACAEPRQSTPILGLEESLRADPDSLALFALAGAPGPAQAIGSPS